jgi:phosphatidylserine/phosphatidylglycerophosphate/cardiolipin synthase-like enzyme
MATCWKDYCCFGFLCACLRRRYNPKDEEEVEDDDAVGLSHVGTAAYDVLRKRHHWHHHSLWNVTSGHVVSLDHTPKQAWTEPDVLDGHSDWFPKKLAEIVARTEIWCDVLSLGPPDGVFMTEFNAALKQLHEKDKKITVRMMFGNIIGMPVNCTAVIKHLTKDIPKETKLRLWVGAWRKGVSWNHAKIIAVDGNFLHTGGHNLWDGHYLRHDPVHDLSLELEGRVAHDGHLFANQQWMFIELMQRTFCGYCIDKLPDSLPVALKSRVTVSEFPRGVAPTFPDYYRKGLVPKVFPGRNVKRVPLITMGRYGKLTRFSRRPSDDAILAMLSSAKKILRLALQDLGPVCIPGTKITLPGCVWPHATLNALAKVMYERGVDVEIIVSNPNSIPGGLKATEANYGNGWSCVDVAAEIIKTIRNNYPAATDAILRQKVSENLRVCFLREKRGQHWDDGMTMAMHAKHFIVDDTCCYVGSQNLYVADLAEWGVVIDNKEETARIMEEYWNPMWAFSYTADDCDVDEVMDGLDIDRDGEDPGNVSDATKKLLASKQEGGRFNYEAEKQGGGIHAGNMSNYYETDNLVEEKN